MKTSRVDTEMLFSATRVYLRNISAVISRIYRVDSVVPSGLIYTRIITPLRSLLPPTLIGRWTYSAVIYYTVFQKVAAFYF